MDYCAQFIEEYSREVDFYEKAGKIAADLIDLKLRSTGILAIVTHRAKNPGKLEAKIKKRQKDDGKDYQSTDDIRNDIADLAGVRIALYFPGEKEHVDELINELFQVNQKKEFPRDSDKNKKDSFPYEKRFSGYWANHYRIQLIRKYLLESQYRFIEAKIEIQVASVLMHAWSEVEHDLIYKPAHGVLSTEEYSILDEINGLVIAGEIALERLQRAIESRIKNTKIAFRNHYELAVYLFDSVMPKLNHPGKESRLGDVEILYTFLKQIHVNTPQALSSFTKALDIDIDKRTITQQIIDQILSTNEKWYNVYQEIIRTEVLPQKADISDTEELYQAIGRFLAQWIIVERFINILYKYTNKSSKPNNLSPTMALRRVDVLDQDDLKSLAELRNIRNMLVHGIEIPDPIIINSCILLIENLMNKFRSSENTLVANAATQAMYKY